MSAKNTSTPAKQGATERAVDFRSLDNRPVLINPEVLRSGLVPVFYVASNSRTVLGFTTETPKGMIPITDYNLLQSARSVFTSPEKSAKKGSLLTEIRNKLAYFSVVNKIETNKYSENIVQEMITLNQRADNLINNLRYVDANSDSCELRNFMLLQGMAIARAFNAYIHEVLLKGSEKTGTLKEYLANARVFDWCYRRFTSNRDEDLQKRSFESILFPKKIAKGFTYMMYEAEYEFPEEFQDEFNSTLQEIAKKSLKGLQNDSHSERIKRQVLFIIPPNFNENLDQFSDVPKIVGSETTRLADLTVNLIHSFLGVNPGNVDPGVLYKEYSNAVFSVDFKYLPELTDKPRVQFVRNVRKTVQPYERPKGKWDLFGKFYLTNYQKRTPEEKTFFDFLQNITGQNVIGILDFKGKPKIQDMQFRGKLPAKEKVTLDISKTYGVAGSFPKGSPKIEDFEKSLDSPALRLFELKRVEKKQREFAKNSPLTREAKGLVNSLSLHPKFSDLADDVQSYLARFHDEVFMNLAVKIIHASLQELHVTEGPEETQEEDDSDLPVFDLGQ